MRFIVTGESGQSVVLRDERNHNSVGVWLLADGVDGWFGTPSPREDAIGRSMSDADYMPGTLTQGSRIVTLHGHGYFGSTVEAAHFTDLLNSLAGEALTVACEDAHGRREATGFLSDDPRPTLDQSEQAVDFTLMVTCPDPRKYGRAIEYMPSGGWCQVTNEGNVGSYPSIHVDGPVTQLYVALGDRAVNWSGSADELDIDFRDMLPSSGTVTVDNAFEVPPGQSVLAFSCDGSAATVTLKSAWR